MLGTIFQSDPDLRLAGTEVYLDPSQDREVGIISHAHADHIGRHARFVATAPTAAVLKLRIGPSVRGTELPYFQPMTVDRFAVELWPAGHILGSAMIRIRSDEGSLLYTGDFRLRSSRTAEPAVVEPCDWLITESTYGSPQWRFPDRRDVEEELIDLLRRLLAQGRTPVIKTYPLGKSQEVMALLAQMGLGCVVHPSIARIARIYERFHVDLGPWESWAVQGSLFDRSTRDLREKVLVVPSNMKRFPQRVDRPTTIALTGWALDRRRAWTDHAFPYSDHADFDELLELIDLARPRIVYTTHGASAFARELRRRGIQAEFLRGRPQMRLF